MPTPSPFAKKLAAVAQGQHTNFQFMNEADPALCKQIKKWTEDIGFTFTSCTQGSMVCRVHFVVCQECGCNQI